MYKLYNDDCLKVMPNISEHSVDMILCDLPYGVLNNKVAEWDKIIPFEQLWDNYNRILKTNGIVILFGQGTFFARLILSNESAFRYDFVWNKKLSSDFLNANNKPMRVHEHIAVFYYDTPVYNPQMSVGQPLHSKGTAYKTKSCSTNSYGNYGIVEQNGMRDINGNTLKYPTTLLTFSKVHPSSSVHPSEKPVDLLEYLIRTYTNEGMLVLDNCMGSGSTGVAAIRSNRDFIGIEADEKFFKIAEKRIADAKNISKLNLEELL